MRILVVEDDELCRESLLLLLKEIRAFENVETIEKSCEFESLWAKKKEKFDLCFLDIDLESRGAGFKLIEPLVKMGTFVSILSGYRHQESVEKAYGLGAHDYMTKPIGRQALKELLSRFQNFQKNHKTQSFSSQIKTLDPQLKASISHLDEVIATETPILFQGETGTGKTYMAKMIHDFSLRSQGPFIQINCSEVSDSLLESELFGHVRGAFSGAINDKKGKLELAHGGTLFLDELGSTSKKAQLKLLKAIEEKSFYPVGGEKLIKSDFRVISATCDDLSSLVQKGEFREDLYFRLYGHNLTLKPLRERVGDIDLLIDEILAKSSRKIVITDEARESLTSYYWPGNIRELQRVLAQFLTGSKGIIKKDSLPEHIQNNHHPLGHENKLKRKNTGELLTLGQLEKVKSDGLRKLIQEVENEVVSYFLNHNHGKVRKTMGTLGMSNSSFYRVLDRLNAKNS